MLQLSLLSGLLVLVTSQEALQTASLPPPEADLLSHQVGALQEALRVMEASLQKMKEDLKGCMEIKEKRSMQKGRFATAEQMDQVTEELRELQGLPQNVSEMLQAGRTAMTKGLSQAVTQEELGRFRLAVARDTARLRFSEGEWVGVQTRGQHDNPSDYFARAMAEYVRGFGDPAAEFWIGLDKIATLTRGGAELRIELETFEGDKVYASYKNFEVQGEEYTMTASGYQGTAGDTLRIDNGMAFSAKDLDRDRWSGDCSSTRGGGGWWFNGCGLANLNGQNLGKGEMDYGGILWYFYGNDNRGFRSSRMMVRKN